MLRACSLSVVLALGAVAPPAAVAAPAPVAAPRAALALRVGPDGFLRCPPFPAAPQPPAAAEADPGPPAPEPEPPLPRRPLDDASRDSTSLGLANGGSLLRAAELPASGRWHRMLPQRAEQRFGTRELVAALQEAAAAVGRRYPGSVLVLGNLSRREGGRVRQSASHQSGRDADLLFYLRRARDGRPAPSESFRPLDAQGRAKRGGLVFDAARNWALVEELLAPRHGVQWIFVSEGLRSLLLAEGLRQGAAPALLQRAAATLHQPVGSTPHDDHFHLRLHCSPDDLLDGCRDYGPRRPWAPFPQRAFTARVAALEQVLAEGTRSTTQRLQAVERLEALEARAASATLLRVLAAGPPRLGRRVLQALRRVGDADAALAVATTLRADAPPWRLRGGLDLIEARGDARCAAALVGLASSRRPLGRREPSLGLRSLRVLELLAPAAALAPLVALLPELQEPEAQAARQTLARIAVDERPNAAAQPAAAWAAWVAQAEGDRAAWIERGLRAAGYPLPAGACAVASVPTLADALEEARPCHGAAARDLLRAITELRPWRPGTKALRPSFWRAWYRSVGEPAAQRQRTSEP